MVWARGTEEGEEGGGVLELGKRRPSRSTSVVVVAGQWLWTRVVDSRKNRRKKKKNKKFDELNTRREK